MTETRFFGFICHLPMPLQRCAEGLKTWFLWVLLRLFQYLPNSSSISMGKPTDREHFV